jgi:hypothetical protein
MGRIWSGIFQTKSFRETYVGRPLQSQPNLKAYRCGNYPGLSISYKRSSSIRNGTKLVGESEFDSAFNFDFAVIYRRGSASTKDRGSVPFLRSTDLET